MRLYSVLTITHISSFIGGCLLLVAMQQTSFMMSGGFAILAIVLAILPAARTVYRLRQSVRELHNLANPEHQTKTTSLAFVELTGVADQFKNTLRKAANTIAHSKGELQNIREFLLQVDRRGFGGRDGETTSVKQFVGMLKSYGDELNDRINQVLSCGREIERCTDKLVVGSENQAEVVNRTVSFVDRMAAHVESVAQNGQTAVASSITARESAVDCLREIEAVTNDMTQMRDHVAAREKKLRVLGDHTNEIGSIAETIGTISSRTDLLALNASIESVRAGEHGRGFAVVAEEVRNLAEQAAQAARDVAVRIESVQIETQQSIAVAADEHSKMEQVIQRVNSACEALHRINELATESLGSTQQISLASQQQLDLSNDVVEAMDSFAEVTRQFRSQSEGARWTAKTLANLGGQLDGALDLFRQLNQSGQNRQSTVPETFVDSEAMKTGYSSHDSALDANPRIQLTEFEMPNPAEATV